MIELSIGSEQTRDKPVKAKHCLNKRENRKVSDNYHHFILRWDIVRYSVTDNFLLDVQFLFID